MKTLFAIAVAAIRGGARRRGEHIVQPVVLHWWVICDPRLGIAQGLRFDCGDHVLEVGVEGKQAVMQ